jgi:hypothetical protein
MKSREMSENRAQPARANLAESKPARRGRPKANGRQSDYFFLRDLNIVAEFTKFREAGEKHTEALKETVKSIQQKYPGMKVSVTEVKRVLARKWSARSTLCLLPREPNDEERIQVTPRGQRVRIVLRVFGGPRPQFPRHNAK